MNWKPYLNNRLIAKQEDYYVILPEDYELPIPLDCPLCKRLLRTKDDESSYLEFSCCNYCALKFAHARRKEWKEGWRPSKEQIKEVLEEFKYMSVIIDFQE